MITYSSRVHLVLHGTNPSGLPHFTKETQGMLLDEALRAEIFVHCVYLGKSETAGISAPYVFAWPNTYCYINAKHCRGPQTVGPQPQSNHYRWQAGSPDRFHCIVFKALIFTVQVGYFHPSPKITYISSGWDFQGQLGESGLLLRCCKILDPKSPDG